MIPKDASAFFDIGIIVSNRHIGCNSKLSISSGGNE